ncbi:MAG TPA: hypothetical protein VGV59_10945 [Pyrinomonadaceae bacterium]|nr:hypothetical protein [Pyrinomonadaceae bacterium]
MIIDQMTLAGLDAYLTPDGREVNLALPPREGRSLKIGEGMVVDVSSISVQFDHENIVELFNRQPQPLFSVGVVKEVFPGLFTDPYSHRVHGVNGYEDFNRGSLSNLRVMDVEGVPTLVSVGDEQECRWRSAVYRMPRPLTFDAAAWEMPTSRLTPTEGFTYDMRLFYWIAGQDVDRHGAYNAPLTQNATPDAERTKTGLQSDVKNVIAYQFEFKARVKHDAFLRERHTGHFMDKSLGRPLLTSVNLLESVTSAYTYHSLQEVLDQSLDYQLIAPGGVKPRRFCARLNIAATLVEGESISLKIHDAQCALSYVDAHLNARVLLRPPLIDKE